LATITAVVFFHSSLGYSSAVVRRLFSSTGALFSVSKKQIMLRSAFLLSVVFAISIACNKKQSGDTPSPDTAPVFKLAWEENFNSQQLDTTNWFHRIPGVRHDGFNDTTTVSVSDGNLYIKVYSDTVNGAITHHTGMIATKKEFRYGKFEARISFVNKYGSWSAFWLQSATMGNPIGNPQAAGMEIDVVETLSNDGRVHHNLHWDGYGTAHKTTGLITPDLGANSGNYHVYTLEWTPKYYKFYVDGQLTWTYQAVISQRSEFIILSSEVKNYTTGSWAGPIPAGGYGSKEKTATIMKVDYVKCYSLQ
jgi:beta-glucanase (GH16 family)